MAEGTQEGGDEGFSFVDKVRLMMYGEQEKEAFLIDKKEKEEKKKGESESFSLLLPPRHTCTRMNSQVLHGHFDGKKTHRRSAFSPFLLPEKNRIS